MEPWLLFAFTRVLFLVLSSLGGGLVGSRVCFDMVSDT